MRKVVYLIPSLLCLTLCFVTNAQTVVDGGPEIRFEVKRIDYGEVQYRKDSVYVYQFVYENTGTEPLIVNQVQPHCPCVTVDYSVDPLSPGQKDTLIVHFKPARASKYTQNITVLSNATEYSVIQLYAKGNFLKPSEWKARQQQKTDSQ